MEPESEGSWGGLAKRAWATPRGKLVMVGTGLLAAGALTWWMLHDPCCKRCTEGQACGDTCIEEGETCHQDAGCACED